jgi:hypothetical protein
MRLWSLHPKYLDSKGLVALWREGLLARAVLKGETTGYKNHPQLDRFKNLPNPLTSIDTYLMQVFKESERRHYKFNRTKIGSDFTKVRIHVTSGQIKYEMEHLRSKLRLRDHAKYLEIRKITNPDANPIFSVVDGDVEPWEVLK